jgi:MFS family permease
LGYVNGVLWAIGNGLTTSTLVIYLALDLGAQGMAISLILAAPAVVGVLRIFTPAIIHQLGTSKRTCLIFSLASYLLLWGLPAAGVANLLPMRITLTGLIVLLCTHQMLEFIASVALWAWLGDLVPSGIRGRYFGRRQMYQLLALIPTLLLSGWFTNWWRDGVAGDYPQWKLAGYAIPCAFGVVFLLVSLVPLVQMPATRPAPRSQQVDWLALVAPLKDPRFRAFLYFGAWISFANGISQSAQNIYPKAILGLGVFELAAMRTVMRMGQVPVSRGSGALSDAFGNRPVLIVCQLIVATGPLFFLAATPEGHGPWLLWGAWIAWAAFAGLNVCLPNMTLKLAEPHDRTAYLACWFTISSIAYTVSTVGGGYLLDFWKEYPPRVLGPVHDRFDWLFLIGWIARTAGVLFLFRVAEPGAWRWREMFRFGRRPPVRDILGTAESDLLK